MSGGVDSTACALLLKTQHEVEGFFMHLAQPNFDEQRERVETIAKKLGIKLHIIDLRNEFEKQVLHYFSSSYFNGLTPNPCVICNREIKFGLFMNSILAHNMEKIATGHYARIIKEGDLYKLHCGADPKKDQSYFLSRLTQQQLSRIIFPLGEQSKQETYEFVEQHGFNDFRGLESQDVCFLEDKNVGSYLKTRTEVTDNSGPIVSSSGEHLGVHSGLFNYTIGQRKGLGISSATPLYVIALDKKTNSVIVGKDEELFCSTLHVKDLHWISTPPSAQKTYNIRIRYSHRGSPASIRITGNNNGIIEFLDPQRAITPGQFAVIYDNTEVIGSAIIT